MSPTFFNIKDLLEWSSQLVNQPYNKDTDQEIREWIKFNLASKLSYWTDQVVQDLNGWIRTGRLDFLDRNRTKIRHYLWLKIQPVRNHPDLFFTLSIAENSGNNKPGLVIKLDFKRSGIVTLNPVQIQYLEKKLDRNIEGVSWTKIDNIELLDWQSLVEQTTSFVRNNHNFYNQLLDDLAEISGDYRLARICWNSDGWIKPSGENGKSKLLGTHEKENGFGHEEWLFDTSKLIDGYHYSFLEPIYKHQETFEGKNFHIGLYTINYETKKRYWLGFINNVEVVRTQDAEKIKAKYELDGWYKEMINQLKEVNAKAESINSWNDGQLFNIRYRPENLKIVNYEPIPEDHPIYNISRYTFIKSQSIITSFLLNEYDNTIFIARPGEPTGSDENSSHQRAPKMVQVKKKHLEIQKKLLRFLRENFGDDNVTWEFNTESRTQVDIARKDGNHLYFYEIKTYPSLRTSIREAFGQLIEYAHWSERLETIDLIIVTDLPIDDSSKRYISYLRDNYNIPISYAWFDLTRNELVEYSF